LTTTFKINFDLFVSSFQFNINSEKEILTIGINVISIYLIYFIEKLQDKIDISNRQHEKYFDFIFLIGSISLKGQGQNIELKKYSYNLMTVILNSISHLTFQRVGKYMGK